jgi:hypothetical protein
VQAAIAAAKQQANAMVAGAEALVRKAKADLAKLKSAAGAEALKAAEAMFRTVQRDAARLVMTARQRGREAILSAVREAKQTILNQRKKGGGKRASLGGERPSVAMKTGGAR